jgi:hypothetical protein
LLTSAWKTQTRWWHLRSFVEFCYFSFKFLKDWNEVRLFKVVGFLSFTFESIWKTNKVRLLNSILKVSLFCLPSVWKTHLKWIYLTPFVRFLKKFLDVFEIIVLQEFNSNTNRLKKIKILKVLRIKLNLTMNCIF